MQKKILLFYLISKNYLNIYPIFSCYFAYIVYNYYNFLCLIFSTVLRIPIWKLSSNLHVHDEIIHGKGIQFCCTLKQSVSKSL